jgi:membrane protein implicated in regulation of membrane protease activity
MSNYVEWWEGLNGPLKIFWVLAIPFSVFFILQLFSTIFGHDHHDAQGHDSHFDDAGAGFHLFTLKNLIAFFCIFGWVGIAALDSGFSTVLAFVFATIGGLIVMVLMTTLVYYLARASVDGTMKFKNAVGVAGEVYLTIPANRASVGQVQIKVQGSLRTLEAITDDDKDIPTGKLIKVMKVVNNNLLVVTAD